MEEEEEVMRLISARKATKLDNPMLNRALLIMILLVLVIAFPAFSSDAVKTKLTSDEIHKMARRNGILANEGFWRSNRYLLGWLAHADPQSGLIPQNLDWDIYKKSYKKGGRDTWNAKDAAADNYSFMVLTGSITNRSLFEGRLFEMLKTETKLTSRIDSLPDTYSFKKCGFMSAEPNLNRIMFGSSEYIKDGLLPLTEWLGHSPWSERMIGMIDDMWKHAPIQTSNGNIVSNNVEVNGEMMQTLSRIYWMTGDVQYLDWAVRLGDFYLLGNQHPTRDFSSLRLRDHGCEVISGLCELYATVHFARPDKKAAYEKPLHEMLDRILEIGRNEHGLFYNIINPRTGQIRDKQLVDTWGYTYNGYYTVYLIDKTETYRKAVQKTLASLNENYRNYAWEDTTFDGYADAIESAINLYNREPDVSVAQWVDSEIKVMWGVQKDDGVIEGWHCDGNFARTSIMYSLWKTKGVTIQPWRKDVIFGAVVIKDELWFNIVADSPWDGKLIFDTPRHKTIMKLPFDWPRTNQWQEWFVVEGEKCYVVTGSSSEIGALYSGRQLHEGYDVTLKAGEEMNIRIVLNRKQ